MTADRWTSGSHYDQWMGRWSRLLAGELLKWLQLPTGLRWIDACCGSGVLSEAIVERCAPARVAGVDASPEQISFARQHRGRSNVVFETANAMVLPFPDSSFDVVVCGLGLNYIPEPAQGLKEFQRVVSSGGTIAAYVWDYKQGARFLREFWDAATAVDEDAASFDQARRFPMCTEEGLRGLFEAAKLEAITGHALEITTRFTSFDDYWEPLLTGQGSAPNYLATRGAETQAKIRERLRAMLPATAEDVIELPARAWAICGRRP